MATNQKNFKHDLQLELQHSENIKEILGKCFITKDQHMDLEEGTDFLIFNIKPFKIGARLRRYDAFLIKSYRSEFTIRWSRPSKKKTEIHKIMEGLVEYIFYGFLNEDETEIIQWFIGDLSFFKKGLPSPHVFPNTPPDSRLAVFKIDDFPVDFIIKSHNLPLDNVV